MKPGLDPSMIIQQAADLLGQPVATWRRATHGADHLVLFITMQDGRYVVAKAGAEADIDAYVLEQLSTIDAKVPRVIAHAPLMHNDHGDSLLVMSAVDAPLMADVLTPPAQYLPSLIAEMQQVHRITLTSGAGSVLRGDVGAHWTWQEYLLRILTGQDAEFAWPVIRRDSRLDQQALSAGMDWLDARVRRLAALDRLSLLHGDLNPYNIFVNDREVVGIIDWSYARAGDPLFDFARLRMNPLIRNDQQAVTRYFELLQLSAEEREREHVYYVFNLLEYVNWYYSDQEIDRVQEQLALIAHAISA